VNARKQNRSGMLKTQMVFFPWHFIAKRDHHSFETLIPHP
jgi:hypothetical protein